MLCKRLSACSAGVDTDTGYQNNPLKPPPSQPSPFTLPPLGRVRLISELFHSIDKNMTLTPATMEKSVLTANLIILSANLI